MQQTSDPTMTLNDFWEIYKADMRKVESLEERADKIKENNMEQSHENIQLKVEARKLNADVEQLEERTVELAGQVKLLETKEKEQ